MRWVVANIRRIMILSGLLTMTMIRSMRGTGKRFVYILQSNRDPSSHYVGVTSNVEERLEWHNHGPAGHTVSHGPWSVIVSVEFPSEQQSRPLRALPEVRLRPRLREAALRADGRANRNRLHPVDHAIYGNSATVATARASHTFARRAS